MQLDIRLPIGLMFSIFGVLLIAFGLMSDAAIYQRSLDININLIWGLALLVFGLLMLLLTWLASRVAPKSIRQDAQKGRPNGH